MKKISLLIILIIIFLIIGKIFILPSIKGTITEEEKEISKSKVAQEEKVNVKEKTSLNKEAENKEEIGTKEKLPQEEVRIEEKEESLHPEESQFQAKAEPEAKSEKSSLDKKEKTTKEFYKRQEISFLKFVSSENCLYFLDESEIAQLKNLNINGIRICPAYSIGKDGTLREEVPEFIIINLIRKAHQAGFAVFLEVNLAGPPGSTEFGGFPSLTDPNSINKVYEASLHWAKIAEKENVEFYSPLNEPNATFGTLELTNQWIKKSQSLRPSFSGNFVLKLADTGPSEIGNIEKYDYLAFDIMWGDAKYNELKEYLKNAIEKGNNLKKQYKLKGFFFGELGAMREMVSKDVQAEIFKIIFQESWGQVDGYCFLGWSNLEFRFKDNSDAKKIIKKWYSSSAF